MKKLLLGAFLLSFILCYGQTKPEPQPTRNQAQFPMENNGLSFFNTPSLVMLDKNIRSIFQDKKGNFWFGTNGAGVYRYDGEKLQQFTEKDGLSNNQIQHIQEDKSGNIWFGTGLFGVSKYDGKKITSWSKMENNPISDKEWKMEMEDLWFYGGGGVFRFHQDSLDYLPLINTEVTDKVPLHSPFNLSRYAVYSILKDKNGSVWFGTQAEGVCRYDGKSFVWFTEKGLRGPAVLGIFEDSKGNIWFGNNGSGLFRYDGKSMTHVSEEIKRNNPSLNLSGQSSVGGLSRIYIINEDHIGNLWIGTVDNGVWRYGAGKLTHFTDKDGLTGNAVNIIYRDQNGELWFGTDKDGIFKFNGNSFESFQIKNK